MKVVLLSGMILFSGLCHGENLNQIQNQILDGVQVTEIESDDLIEGAIQNTPTQDSALSESQVPLSLTKNESKSTGEFMGPKLIVSLVAIIIVLMGGLYFLRKMAQPKNSPSGAKINLLTQHWLGPKKSLAIIRVAGESILIGITDQNINMIKSLSLLDEDIPDSTPISFSNTIKSINQSDVEMKSSDEEDFTFNQLKESIGKKIKNLRSIH